jgi:hypothetical protein
MIKELLFQVFFIFLNNRSLATLKYLLLTLKIKKKNTKIFDNNNL